MKFIFKLLLTLELMLHSKELSAWKVLPNYSEYFLLMLDLNTPKTLIKLANKVIVLKKPKKSEAGLGIRILSKK